tara:strand:+ start:321 stop:1688 length:1368 start_codon:yes stop_codon:yes gene_type:complete
MALEDIEKNKEKINQAALSVIEKGAPPISADEQTFDEQDIETMKKMNINPDNYFKTEDGNYQLKEGVKVDIEDIEGETEEGDGKFKIELGSALSTKLDSVTGSLASFTETVGDTFENIATQVPKKIDEIYSDKDKKRNFLRGLYIINASSGITPISQAKSPLGKISEGLIKAEKQFTAEDIATLKAQKKEPRRYPGAKETLLIETFKKYKEDDKDKLKEFIPISQRYNLAKKIALDGNELPTGILNKTFSDIKAFLSEVPGGEEAYNALAAKFTDKDYGSKMKLEDQVIFNDLFQAATFQQVVQEVKKLYPVSNKDIDTLLQTKGDIGSKPEALMRLIAVEMATKEIYMNSRPIANKYFEIEDLDFEQKSILDSEKMIAAKIRENDSVATSTIEELFGKGSAEDITDAGLITAYYYQSLKSEQVKGEMDSFTIFVTAEKEKEKIITDITEKYKKD